MDKKYLFIYKKCAIVISQILVCIIFLTSCSYDDGVGFYESTDISTYRNFGVPSFGGLAYVYCFPENLDKVESINNYYFVANYPPVSRTSWEILLDVTYSEEEYNLEIERITNFKETSSKIKRELWYDKDCILFNYPTYIFKYDTSNYYHQYYEYIIVDELNYRLIYIYLERPARTWYEKKHFREIVVPLEYQPKNYFNNQNKDTCDNYYFTIYTKDEDLIWLD